jgi:RNA polymerase-binding transcription factor
MIRTRSERVVDRPDTPTGPAQRTRPLPARALQRLVRQLDERERELRAKIDDERYRVHSEGLAQLDGEIGDDVDRASVNMVVGLKRDMIDRCVSELNEIAAAQERIARGEGGICMDCGEQIETARLDANPIARRCTDCQARSEIAARIAMR